MPYLRIVRDKRGYEYFSLIQPSPARRGKVRQRLLYWFRTPPNLKLGRPPFNDEVMRTLEAQNPDVQFDWEALRSTPMPPPSSEPWRERRRAEKAARQFRESDDAEAADEALLLPVPAAQPEPPGDEAALLETGPILETVSVVEIEVAVAVSESVETSALAPAPAPEQGQTQGRRRRRRGRRGRGDRPPAAGPGPTEDVPPSSTSADSSPETAGDESGDPD